MRLTRGAFFLYGENMKFHLIGYHGGSGGSGYGNVEKGVLRSLLKIGAEITTDWDYLPRGKMSEKTIYPYTPEDPETVVLVIGTPQFWDFRNLKRKPWVFTMSESDRVHPQFIKDINDNFERLLVPSLSQIGVFMNSGLQVPIHSITHGLDIDLFQYREPERGDYFRWLTYSVGGWRKGADHVVNTFLRMFKGDDGHHLYVHVPCDPREEYNIFTGVEHPQITFLRWRFHRTVLSKLYQTMNAFVFPTHAEGFGMPPREAALLGLPTIATQWSGTFDVGNWGFPVRVDELETGIFQTPKMMRWLANYPGVSKWATIDEGNLEYMMRWVYENL